MLITDDTFVDALHTLTTSKKYYDNCVRYSAMLDNATPTSIDEFIVHSFEKSLKPSRRVFKRYPFKEHLNAFRENFVDVCAFFVFLVVFLSC
ncbi:hypothetical protein L596_005828 [Steinernema carpocapsae]|uniref:Uncharacterized protein n=1 Tax=Steinernema carpocapsae TaxID=34508 RepID=A0A4U8V1U0_STECR|nr:hypothetical protein L596_005828 [Steinernema carpocapsae]